MATIVHTSKYRDFTIEWRDNGRFTVTVDEVENAFSSLAEAHAHIENQFAAAQRASKAAPVSIPAYLLDDHSYEASYRETTITGIHRRLGHLLSSTKDGKGELAGTPGCSRGAETPADRQQPGLPQHHQRGPVSGQMRGPTHVAG